VTKFLKISTSEKKVGKNSAAFWLSRKENPFIREQNSASLSEHHFSRYSIDRARGVIECESVRPARRVTIFLRGRKSERPINSDNDAVSIFYNNKIIRARRFDLYGAQKDFRFVVIRQPPRRKEVQTKGGVATILAKITLLCGSTCKTRTRHCMKV
jgi:hypothetical protein